MEKLIELYYEHKLDLLKRDMRVNWATEREIELADIEKVEEEELEKNLDKLSDLKPFIKWLVENDKIDQTNKFCVSVNVEWKGMGYTKAFEGYESLLMLLAIQEEPVSFLISILK